MNDQHIQTGDDLVSDALKQPAATPGSDDVGAALTSLQNVIERNANELDRVLEELKIERQSLKNVFENDVELDEIAEKANAVSVQVKERKSKIQSSPQATQIKTKITELSEQKKEIEEALNNHLLNLYQLTGSKTFDTSSGMQREFRVRANLISGKKDSD